MAKKSTLKIVCPNCNKNITLDDALTQSFQENLSKQLEKKYSSEVTRIKKEVSVKESEIKQLKSSISTELEKALEGQKKEIEKEAKKRAEDSLSKDLKDLKEQVKEKDEKLQKAEGEELKLRKEKRDLEEAKKKFELEIERKLDEERKKISEETVERVEKEHKLKDKEKGKQIDDLRKQINELKRKAEQGSQKLQGEVLEQELENVLRDHFAQDEIEPIPSGVSGADISQKVFLKSGKICGSILIESKNAKNWSDAWVSKIKKDQRNAKADIAVIVTTALPQGVTTFDCRDGIILVHYNNVIPVIMLLRNQLFEVARTKSFSVGKNEKMEAIYNYLTGIEFRQKVEAIVEAFGQMYNDLQKEKRTMTRVWSKREKQIEQAVYGVAGMYGGMQGILGSSLPEIKSLEMNRLLTHEEAEDTDDEEEK